MIDSIPRIAMSNLISRYAVLLLDAYGVLITHDGAMPGAKQLVDTLNRTDKSFYVLTNDASRSPHHASNRFQEMGLSIDVDRIITSGSILPAYFKAAGLQNLRCVVLGTEDSIQYVVQAGGKPVSLDAETDAECLVVGDERGYPLRESLDHVLNLLYRKIDRDDSIHMILPNPDLIYPSGKDRFGFTAGSVALLLEEALKVRYPGRTDLRFKRLGKPHSPMFEEASRRAGSRDMIMIGDQPGTDIQGAKAFGIDSALMTGGVAKLDAVNLEDGACPTYVLTSLSLD